MHEAQADQDEARTELLEALGYRVLRFRNEDVERDIETVLRAIVDACR
ncbi:MAG: DUF559 domain-containing protein [Chloroflexi bacterium]|nr:DUF559 domain-containing protein [Chloroflexota bacterium]